MSTSRYSSILGSVDSAFYFVERPETPMNIGALAIYDGLIDFEHLSHLIATRLHRAPRYQERVIQAPFNLGQPTWIPDPNFQIRHHIKRATLPAPGGEKELRALTDRLLSRTLDRDRPLWEVTVINGYDEKTAIFFKVHHCMVDGLAAVELFSMLMDLTVDLPGEEEKPLHDVPPLPDPLRLTLDSFSRDWSHRFQLIGKMGKELETLGTALRDGDRRTKMLVAFAHLISNNLRPIRKLPINGKNSGRQHLIWHEVALEEVQAIRKAAPGATVNDVMLSFFTDAIERYSKRHAADQVAKQPFLRILIPVNVREATDHSAEGNRISVLPIDSPLNVANPLERLKGLVKYSAVMKQSSLSMAMDMILTLPSLSLSVLQPAIWGAAPAAFSMLAHTWCTNVAAPPMPVYLLGHKLEHVYGYFPLNPTMGAAGVVVSYNGTISLTLVTDEQIIPDRDAIETDLKAAYADLRAAAGVKPVAPVAITVIPTAPEEALTPAPIAMSAATASPISNGYHTAEAVSAVAAPVAAAAPAPAPAPVAEAAPTRYRLFSQGWADQFAEAVNTSAAYRRAGASWTAGSLAFVMRASPEHGFDKPAAVLLDLHKGICRDAQSIPLSEAEGRAHFIITGEYSAWMEVLEGGASPLRMLSTGRLHLHKGSLLTLLPHTRSASELVNCARQVEWY